MNKKTTYYSSMKALDPSTRAFVRVAGITSGLQTRILDDTVRALKTENIWSSLLVAYPFLGNNFASHKYNLIDPRDTDDAFRLTQGNVLEPEIDAWGMKFAGYSGQNVNTHFVPATHFVNGDHVAVYVTRTYHGSSYSGDVDTATEQAADGYYLNAYNGSGIAYAGLTGISANVTNAAGFSIGNSTTDPVQEVYREGLQIISTATVPNKPVVSLTLGGQQTAVVQRTYGWVSLGNGLTQTQVVAYDDIITTYQARLNRTGIALSLD